MENPFRRISIILPLFNYWRFHDGIPTISHDGIRSQIYRMKRKIYRVKAKWKGLVETPRPRTRGFKGSTTRGRNVEPVLHDLLNSTLLIHDAFEKFAFFRRVFFKRALDTVPSYKPYSCSPSIHVRLFLALLTEAVPNIALKEDISLPNVNSSPRNPLSFRSLRTG